MDAGAHHQEIAIAGKGVTDDHIAARARVSSQFQRLAFEAAVIDQVRGLLRAPEVIVATWAKVRERDDGLTEADVREALQSLDPLWDELFPAEQARVLQLLIERVEVHPDGLDLRVRIDGLQSLVADIGAAQAGRRAA